MKLTDEQIARIKYSYNDWAETGDFMTDEWKEGYQSGMYDLLLDLGCTGSEAKEILTDSEA